MNWLEIVSPSPASRCFCIHCSQHGDRYVMRWIDLWVNEWRGICCQTVSLIENRIVDGGVKAKKEFYRQQNAREWGFLFPHLKKSKKLEEQKNKIPNFAKKKLFAAPTAPKFCQKFPICPFPLNLLLLILRKFLFSLVLNHGLNQAKTSVLWLNHVSSLEPPP